MPAQYACALRLPTRGQTTLQQSGHGFSLFTLNVQLSADPGGSAHIGGDIRPEIMPRAVLMVGIRCKPGHPAPRYAEHESGGENETLIQGNSGVRRRISTYSEQPQIMVTRPA
jgi:hypothetical protein